jgi:hypothetical protein
LLGRLHGELIAAFVLAMASVAFHPDEFHLVCFAQL